MRRFECAYVEDTVEPPERSARILSRYNSIVSNSSYKQHKWLRASRNRQIIVLGSEQDEKSTLSGLGKKSEALADLEEYKTKQLGPQIGNELNVKSKVRSEITSLEGTNKSTANSTELQTGSIWIHYQHLQYLKYPSIL